MKKKTMDLLLAIGNIDDRLIEGAAPSAPTEKRRKRFRWEIAAACLCLAFAAVILSCMLFTPRQSAISKNEIPVDQNAPTRVEISDLLGGIEDTYTETALRYTMLPIGTRVAEYHQLSIGEEQTKVLMASVGEPLEDIEGFFRLRGHDEYQYIIRQEGDDLSLWTFSAFLVYPYEEAAESTPNDPFESSTPEPVYAVWNQFPWYHENMNFTPYGYDLVLKTIYGLNDAADIAEIIVSPADMDMTDEGIALQNEIGTFTISNEEDIRRIYDAISGMTCYGGNNWERIELGNSTLEGVRQSRYLEIRLKNGGCVDSLKYTAISNSFYEYSGIAYSALDSQTALALEQILGI